MKPVDNRQRMGALAMAIGMTFSIVWALSSYAYAKPTDAEPSPAVAKLTRHKTCS